jgi:hypothetical protein
VWKRVVCDSPKLAVKVECGNFAFSVGDEEIIEHMKCKTCLRFLLGGRVYASIEQLDVERFGILANTWRYAEVMNSGCVDNYHDSVTSLIHSDTPRSRVRYSVIHLGFIFIV